MQSRIPTLRDKAIVLLIAHPDDEAMFFAPTVLGLTRKELGNHLKILCLSSGISPDPRNPRIFSLTFSPGNAENIGLTRKREIVSSARILGLRSDDDVLVYEDSAFPDSMVEHWDPARIAAVLSSFFAKSPAGWLRKQADGSRGEVPKASIDVLITFDRDGVSGHPNHSSLYHGVVAWLQGLMKGRTGWECPVAFYRLTSTSILRKYMAMFDAPLTMVLGLLDSMQSAGKKGETDLPRQLLFLNDLSLYRRAQKAMTTAHISQMRWFRWGWICLSRYMIVNDLKRERLVFR